MAIISLTEYQALPAYDSSQSDAEINALIPQVEAHFLQIRGTQMWDEIIANTTNGSAVLEEITDRKYRHFLDVREDFMPGQECSGSGIASGAKILSWDDELFTVTLDSVCTATAGEVVITIYPAGAKLIVSRMIKYLFENDGESSYRLGDETQEFESFLGIYPRSIVAGIERYVGFK